jgi:hypothetical protein
MHRFLLQTRAALKVKVRLRRDHESADGQQRYSSTLSLTSALDGNRWLTPRPGRFTPGQETRYPLYRRLGGSEGRSGRLWKISPPPGFVRPARSESLYRLSYPGPQREQNFRPIFLQLILEYQRYVPYQQYFAAHHTANVSTDASREISCWRTVNGYVFMEQ